MSTTTTTTEPTTTEPTEEKIMSTTTEPTTTNQPTVSTVVADLVAGSTVVYLAADKSTRAAVRKALEADVAEAVRKLDLPAATQAQVALDLAKDAKAPTVTPKADLTQALADKINSFRHAADLLVTLAPLAEDIDLDRLADMINSEGPITEAQHAAALKIAEGVKINSGTKASGRDLGQALSDLNDTLEPGTFLRVSEICTKAGLGSASSGAVAARLFPGGDKACTLTFLTPVDRSNDGTPRGAIFNGPTA